jgi:hypothetical protein
MKSNKNKSMQTLEAIYQKEGLKRMMLKNGLKKKLSLLNKMEKIY